MSINSIISKNIGRSNKMKETQDLVYELYVRGDVYALARAAGYTPIFGLEGFYESVSPLEAILKKENPNNYVRRALSHPDDECAVLIYRLTPISEACYIRAPLSKIWTIEKDEAESMAECSVKPLALGFIGGLSAIAMSTLGGYFLAEDQTASGAALIGLAMPVGYLMNFFVEPTSGLSSRTRTSLEILYKDARQTKPDLDTVQTAASEGFQVTVEDAVHELMYTAMFLKVLGADRFPFLVRFHIRDQLKSLEQLRTHPAACFHEEYLNSAVEKTREVREFLKAKL